MSVPNGVLASMRIESLTARDRMRLFCTLSLQLGTTAAQLRELISGIERLLRAHPRIWPDNLLVSLRQLGPLSLDVDVTAWFMVAPEEFAKLRSDLLLEMMELVERARAVFAAPPPIQPAREQK